MTGGVLGAGSVAMVSRPAGSWVSWRRYPAGCEGPKHGPDNLVVVAVAATGCEGPKHGPDNLVVVAVAATG